MEKCIRNLASAVLLQAARDYCEENDAKKKVIIKDLNSGWMDLLTNGMSRVVAQQLPANERQIRKRLKVNVGGNKMAKYCCISGKKTNCTDDCKKCAKEVYSELKKKAGKSEIVAEDAIRIEFSDGEFELLKEHGYIEYCTTIQGRKMYAI